MRAEVDRGHTMSSRLAGPVTTGMRSHLQRIIAMLLPIRVQLACWALAAAAVSGCTGSLVASHHVANHHAASRTAPPPFQPVTRATAQHCPVTIIRHVVGPPGTSAGDVVPGTSVYGTGKLRVTLAMNGVIVAGRGYARPDGSISWKFPWWRLVQGSLTITGRRLDTPAPPVRPDIPAGYGDSGFQASRVIFPSEGCWQITGTIDRTSLSFVTLVITKAHQAVISGSH